MLTDLTFLNIGQFWPPKGESDRLQKYRENRALFEGKHNEVYKDWVRLLRDDKKASLEIILNWHKRLSLLWADLLLSEPPKISVGKEGSTEQQEADKIIEDNSLINLAHEVTIDISRYGDGLFNIYHNGKRGVISASPPRIWFPVVDQDNIKKVLYHVLAWTYKVGAEDKQKAYLKVQIHEIGKYREKVFLLDESKIKSVFQEEKTIETYLDDFAVIPVHNTMTTESIYGFDDYTDLDSILQEMEIRIAQISRILDKHSDPNMYGDESALEVDEQTGQTVFKGGGKFFPVSQGGEKPGYLVWDAQLESNWKELEFLLNQLYIISETSSACFGDLKQGLAESGSALRRLMMAALAKTQRIRMNMDPAVKKAVKLCSRINKKVDLTQKSITIFWKDGLPRDDREEAELMAVRTGGSGGEKTISRRTAIKRMDNMTDADVDEEMDRIAEDEAATNPMSTPPFSGDNKIDGAAGNLDSDLSYNGAQISSAVEIIKNVSAGSITPETAVIMLVKFLRMDETQAREIVEKQQKVKLPDNTVI
jgi:hypothetical protein